MTTIGDLKKKIANLDDDTPCCIGTSDIPLLEEPTHIFENGHKFIICQTEIGFVDEVGYMNDDGEITKGKVFILV